MRSHELTLALHPPEAERFVSRLARRNRGRLPRDCKRAFDWWEDYDDNPPPPKTALEAIGGRVESKIAVLPIRGVIEQHPGFFVDTATDHLARAFDDALASHAVSAIVLDIDSPGGVVYGVPELADKIYAARGVKPIYAVANSTAFSAAYWLFTAAEKRFVTPAGEVGSIGVWVMHVDASKMMDDIGWKVTLVSAGKYKVEGNPYEPLGDEAREEMQRQVDRYHEMFVAAVARNLGVSGGAVKRDFGEGRTVGAKEAVARGMADKVATLESVIAGLTAKSAATAARRRGLAIRQHEIG